MVGDFADSVPTALPLPPVWQATPRIQLPFRRNHNRAAPSASTRCAAQTAPAEWRPVVAALIDFGDAIKIRLRVFGALLWEHMTGLPYLTEQSDLDMLWPISDERTALSLVDRLRRLDAKSPVRLDGELELPDGAGVNWRELAQDIADQNGDVLDGVEVRTKAELFRTPVSLS